MKIKLSIAFLLLIVLGFLSCKKDDVKDCEENNYGTVTISNSSDNPYDIYVDDVYKTRVEGNTISSEIRINEGNDRKMYAIQVSGFVLFPTEKTKYLNVISCSDYSWQIL